MSTNRDKYNDPVTFEHHNRLIKSVGDITINFKDGEESTITTIKSYDTGIQLLRALLEQPEVSSVILTLVKQRGEQ